MEPVALDVIDLTAGYLPGCPVLKGAGVTANPGEILAITGPSGAGKSTLLLAMAGLLAPQGGVVSVGGVPLGDRDRAVSAGVVLIPQDNGLAAILTAQENVHVVLSAAGIPPSEARRRTAGALERMGLTAQAEQLVEELSGGQQQRTAIARALAMRGRILLADEVTSELDATNRQRVMDCLRAEASRGVAVVFATHDPEAAATCDRELHLSDGAAQLTRG